MALGDAREGACGAFGMAVALFPVLQGARADADERGKLGLGQAELFANGTGVGPFAGFMEWDFQVQREWIAAE